MDRAVRLLLLGDTHVGFDWPARPRVERRRRGPDFLDRLEEALAPARRGEVDLVVHGGDLFHHPRVPAGPAHLAAEALCRVARRGVPVYVVPGNHERSRLPHPLLLRHRNLFVFDGPRTYVLRRGGLRIALAGFPFTRHIGSSFASRLAATRWRADSADLRLLCMHQAVEGARVGTHDFTFRPGRDVLAASDLPAGFAAVLSGHIHRAQVLVRDLAGRPLPAPVLYPGSVERTAFAERDEPKGCLLVQLRPDAPGGRLERWTFRPLAARPMRWIELDVAGLRAGDVEQLLRRRLAALDRDAVVRVTTRGRPASPLDDVLSAPHLRRLAPRQMNVSTGWTRPRHRDRR